MFLDLLVAIAIGVSVARFIYAKCSVIKSRTKPFTVALHPLAKHQDDAKPLHGKGFT
jgi:hypothetical protein